MRRYSFLILLVSFFTGCGIYSFTNSSLPSHLKTVNIPLFMNQSLEAGIADEVTQELNKEMLGKNLLSIVSDRGDATITGRITHYDNTPYTYGTSGTRNVDIDQYRVQISAEVEFLDNKKNEALFKGVVSGEGIYNFKTEDIKVGREKAVKDIVQRILEKSIQSW